jgi:CRISPR/Cas system Type II protein with McrA/HNH and RuvC-like nuclease domain
MMGAMGLSLSLKLKLRQSVDKANALAVVRKMLSRPPQKVVEMLGAVSVTHETLRKAK